MEESLVISRYTPLALAYIGDSIYDLKVKTYFVEKMGVQPDKYHKKVTAIVSAGAQSEFIESYLDNLTEREREMYIRGRNSSPHRKAKNASIEEYMKATGFEAVLGYLYMIGNMDRIEEIVMSAIDYAIN